MEGKKLNYQFSIFGDFRDISPNNSQTIIELLSIYQDKNFIPSIFQEIPFNIIPNQINNRIMLSNKDGWQMNIGNNRIDLSISFIEKTKYAEMEINDICKEACGIIEKIITKYDKKANRIALNTIVLVDDEISNRINSLYHKNERIADFYNTNKSNEWNEKIMSQVQEETFHNEVINVGTSINMGPGNFQIENKITTFNGITIQFDINTTPANINLRFGSEDIKNFFEIAIKIKNEIESNIEEKVK